MNKPKKRTWTGWAIVGKVSNEILWETTFPKGRLCIFRTKKEAGICKHPDLCIVKVKIEMT